jgi:hypothetical protein
MHSKGLTGQSDIWSDHVHDGHHMTWEAMEMNWYLLRGYRSSKPAKCALPLVTELSTDGLKRSPEKRSKLSGLRTSSTSAANWVTSIIPPSSFCFVTRYTSLKCRSVRKAIVAVSPVRLLPVFRAQNHQWIARHVQIAPYSSLS